MPAELISQVSWNDNVTIIISIIGAIVSILIAFGFVWNMSKRFTTLENDNKTGKEQHNQDVLRLENKINEMEKTYIQREANAKLERKEEIAKEVQNQTAKFANIQAQIDGVRSDGKQIASTVTEVNTKVEYIEKEIRELKECDRENLAFITKWNQRIEDRIKEAEKYVREIVGFLLGKKMMMDRRSVDETDSD